MSIAAIGRKDQLQRREETWAFLPRPLHGPDSAAADRLVKPLRTGQPCDP